MTVTFYTRTYIWQIPPLNAPEKISIGDKRREKHYTTSILIARGAPRRDHRRVCMVQLLRFTIRGRRCATRRFLCSDISVDAIRHRRPRIPTLGAITCCPALNFSLRPIYRVDVMLIQLLMTLPVASVSGRGEIARNHWERSQRLASGLVPSFLCISPRDSWESIAHLFSHKRNLYRGSIISYFNRQIRPRARVLIRYSTQE